jgi:hypothetical protein
LLNLRTLGPATPASATGQLRTRAAQQTEFPRGPEEMMQRREFIGEVLVAVVHRLELAAIDGHARTAKEIKAPA